MAVRRTADFTSRVVPALSLELPSLQIWEDLCESYAHLRSPFLSADFILAVAGVRRLVYVCEIIQDNHAVAFFPFQVIGSIGRWFAAAESVAGQFNNSFGLIAPPGFKIEPSYLLKLAGLSWFSFVDMDEAQLSFGLTGERPEAGPAVCLERGVETYWREKMNANKSFLKDTTRLQRQLRDGYGPLRFTFELEDWRAALDHLIRHKRAQYRRTGTKDVLAPPWKQSLLSALLSESPRGRPLGVLSALYAGETWVASHFGVRRGGLLHYCLPVYNTELSRYAPGRMLLKEIIDSSGALGLDTIELGAGASKAKRDFANAERTYYRGIWYLPNARATLVRAGCSIKWRVDGLGGRARLRANSPLPA